MAKLNVCDQGKYYKLFPAWVQVNWAMTVMDVQVFEVIKISAVQFDITLPQLKIVCCLSLCLSKIGHILLIIKNSELIYLGSKNAFSKKFK